MEDGCQVLIDVEDAILVHVQGLEDLADQLLAILTGPLQNPSRYTKTRQLLIGHSSS